MRNFFLQVLCSRPGPILLGLAVADVGAETVVFGLDLVDLELGVLVLRELLRAIIPQRRQLGLLVTQLLIETYVLILQLGVLVLVL